MSSDAAVACLCPARPPVLELAVAYARRDHEHVGDDDEARAVARVNSLREDEGLARRTFASGDSGSRKRGKGMALAGAKMRYAMSKLCGVDMFAHYVFTSPRR